MNTPGSPDRGPIGTPGPEQSRLPNFFREPARRGLQFLFPDWAEQQMGRPTGVTQAGKVARRLGILWLKRILERI